MHDVWFSWYCSQLVPQIPQISTLAPAFRHMPRLAHHRFGAVFPRVLVTCFRSPGSPFYDSSKRPTLVSQAPSRGPPSLCLPSRFRPRWLAVVLDFQYPLRLSPLCLPPSFCVFFPGIVWVLSCAFRSPLRLPSPLTQS